MPKPKTLPMEVKKMNLNVPADLHTAFKMATTSQSSSMTDVLLDYIRQYVKQHLPSALPRKKGGR